MELSRRPLLEFRSVVVKAMSDGDILFTFVALLFVGWVCYGVGKRVGFAQMRKAEKLRDMAQAETDLEKKADLSIKANQAEDPESPLNRRD
jgi:hypothetical protein